MKKIILLCLMAFSYCARAQYVTIPDANFRNALIQLFPSCFNGSQQMDTTCSDIVNEIGLDVSYKNIADLNGVQYFDGLEYLYCKSNQITNLPALPSSLTYLDCWANQLASLPTLPSTLTYLDCNSNQLTSLPALPSSLTYLFCWFNQLTILPTLPSSLAILECNNNLLVSLPIFAKFIG